VSASARTTGHWISASITLVLMLVVGGMLLRSAVWGIRSYKQGTLLRWGPFLVFSVAAPLIMADLARHLIQDEGLWAVCGNNDVYNRINSTSPYPESCKWASNQFTCTIHCCVPTWIPYFDGIEQKYAWFPPQQTFFPAPSTLLGQFATLDGNDSVIFDASFDKKQQPYSVFTAPLLLWADGSRNTKRGTATEAECVPYGVNKETGYCLLSNSSMPFEEQIKQLPASLGGSCDCSACLPTHLEKMSQSSAIGIVFTITFTYLGFILLALAVLWNADIGKKLSQVGSKWRELRAKSGQ